MMSEAFKKQLVAMLMPEYENTPKHIINNMALIDSSLAAMQCMLLVRSCGHEINLEKDQLARALDMGAQRHVPP